MDVPDVPDKPGEETEADDSARDAENERPTVSPPFDPVAFARDILKPSPQPMQAVRTKAGDAHTKATPPGGIEAPKAPPLDRRTPLGVPAVPAGIARHLTPPPRQPRIKTPTSTLSLANARIPSNLPPRAGAPREVRIDEIPRDVTLPRLHRRGGESIPSMNAVDREWVDLEVATRPPPPNLDPKDDDPIPEPSDLETRPPPADGPGEDPDVEILPDRAPPSDLDEITPIVEVRDERPRATLNVSDIDDLEDEHSADTVRRPLPGSDVKTRAREMADRVSLGDYSGALEIAEKILADSPNDPAASACAANCRTVLRQMYATRIGPLDRVPVVMVPRDQLRWLSIDHRAGFVLSLVDGVSTLEMIIDVSGMAELDTLRILSELAQQRIISLR